MKPAPALDQLLGAGDALTFPARAAHFFRVPADGGPAQVLWVVSPALPDGTRY